MDIGNNFEKLVPLNYLNAALDAKKNRNKLIKCFLEKKKLPNKGWDDITIEQLVNELSSMDSNNYLNKSGIGEREARIVCNLVAKRHFNFGHGIGRSGDLTEPQPKAAGSSIMAKLTNSMLLDLVHIMGIHSAKKCVLFPCATGMTMLLCILSLKLKKPNAKYILWSRIDQKACFKSILTSGLIPIIIDPIHDDDELTTNLHEFESKINELKSENILCILSTTSCFAPRACDDVINLGILAKNYDLFHLVNNAYGLQSTFCTHQIEQGNRTGRIDLFIQSTDKNILVPVGGAIVCGFNEISVDDVCKSYAGRASSSQTLDVFMTLLHLGKEGYLNLVKERKDNFQYLKNKLREISLVFNENVFNTKRNPISMAMSLTSFNNNENVSLLGSMLFTRNVSGGRVITTLDDKIIGVHFFKGWGSHSAVSNIPYLTVAAGLGIKREEIDVFVKKLAKILLQIKNKNT